MVILGLTFVRCATYLLGNDIASAFGHQTPSHIRLSPFHSIWFITVEQISINLEMDTSSIFLIFNCWNRTQKPKNFHLPQFATWCNLYFFLNSFKYGWESDKKRTLSNFKTFGFHMFLKVYKFDSSNFLIQFFFIKAQSSERSSYNVFGCWG